MYCIKCGEKLGESYIFCGKCGTKAYEQTDILENYKDIQKNNVESNQVTAYALSSEKGNSLTGPIPLQDESNKCNGMYLLSFIVFTILLGLNPIAGILLGLPIGFIASNIAFWIKLMKTCKIEYKLPAKATKEAILSNCSSIFRQHGYYISDAKKFIVLTSSDFKNIEYKIIVDETANIFRIDTFWSIKGRFLNRGLYKRPYKASISHNGIIAYIIQSSSL